MDARLGCISVLLLVLSIGTAFPQSYSARPVRLIVPAPPGGGTDIMARLIAARLSESLGQTFVVDNRPGANGAIGLELAARAVADGHTAALLGASQVINPILNKTNYDLFRDFAPVSQTGASPYALAVHSSLPAKSAGELVALAKSGAGKLNYASAGSGSLQHLATELFAVTTGIALVHVPYKGIGASAPDLISGRVQMTMASIPFLIPHVRSKALRPLAVTSIQRMALLPEVPTMVEAGFAGFVVTQWNGVVIPAGTPGSLVARLQGEIARALRHPEVSSRVASDGTEVVASTPREFGAFLRSEHETWLRVVKQAGIRGD